MSIRNIATAGLLLLGITTGMAVDDDIKKQMNSVKKSNQYLYGDAVAPTIEDARGIAEEILYDNINAWAATKKKLNGNFVVNNKKENWTTLSLPRGNMFLAFIYVKKSDIQAAGSAAATVPQTISAPIADKPQGGQTTTPVPAAKPVVPNAVSVIAACTEYQDMAAKIKSLKEAGKIDNYGRYASLEEPEKYYLAIYNQAGKVVAVLTPGEKRINVNTGEPDRVANYSGCGAIGFTAK